MDINLLMGELEVAENPGIETFDPRFGDINTLILEGNYAEGAAQAEEIIREGIYDIRLIGYFMYGVFLEQGPGGLPAVFQSLSGLLGDNWNAVGPVKKRKKQYQTSLKWFVNQLHKKLKYEEDKTGDTYNSWVERVSGDDVQEALDAIEIVRPALGQALEDLSGDVTDGLTKVKDWLTTFHKLVYKEPEPEPEEETEALIEEEESVPEPQSPISPAVPTGLPLSGDVAAEGSYHLQTLLNKLSAFERLVKSEKYALAALVADDINEIIDNFDPKLYFPKIFANFSLLFARHVSELISFKQNKNSMDWAALRELYKVDLESFVAFDGEIGFSNTVTSESGTYEESGGHDEQPDSFSQNPYDNDD